MYIHVFQHFQVFNVRLNKELTVVEDLDILSSAGYATAHDEYIPFTIKGRSLETTNGDVKFTGELVVEFLKVSYNSCTHDIRIVPTFHSVQYLCFLVIATQLHHLNFSTKWTMFYMRIYFGWSLLLGEPLPCPGQC